MKKLKPLNKTLFFENGTDILWSFYKTIPDNPGLAFDMLSRSFQYGVYREGERRFIDQYSLTKSIMDIEINFLFKKRNKERYHVSYREAAIRLSHPLVDQVHEILKNELGCDIGIIPQVQQFKDLLLERGGNKEQIAALPDRHFHNTSVTGVNAMVWEAKLPYSDAVLQDFGRKQIIFADSRTAECLKGKQGYRINNLYYPGSAPVLR